MASFLLLPGRGSPAPPQSLRCPTVQGWRGHPGGSYQDLGPWGAVPTCSPGTLEGTPLNPGVLCLSSREKTARVGRALLLPRPSCRHPP